MPRLFQQVGNAIKGIVGIPGWAEAYNESGRTSTTAAYNLSAWAARAVQLRAEAVSSAPLRLELPDGEYIETHPLLTLLENVNAEMNGVDLLRYTESAWAVYGAGYVEKVRGGGGRGAPVELFYLNPSTMSVETDALGISGFKQQGKTGVIKFARQDVVYFRGMYDPASDLTGLAPLAWALSAATGDRSAESFLSDFFANSAIPALLLSTDNHLQDAEIERVKSWWERLFRGAGKQHRTGIVGAGLKPFQIGVDPSKLALTDVRAALHQTISTALGVPELLISPTNAADLTPVEIARRMFYELTVIPRWVAIASVLNSELLPEYDDLVAAGARLEFDYDDLPALQENADAKSARMIAEVVAGIIRPDVAAAALGYAPEDVPGIPEPAPAAPPMTDTMPADDAPMQDGNAKRAALELERWQRKALKALADGRAAGVPFASDVITAVDHARIADALATATTPAAVKAAFSARGETDPLRELAAEIRAARAALERGE